MAKVRQSYKKTTTTRRVKKSRKGTHVCPNCGGDGICRNLRNQKRKS